MYDNLVSIEWAVSDVGKWALDQWLQSSAQFSTSGSGHSTETPFECSAPDGPLAVECPVPADRRVGQEALRRALISRRFVIAMARAILRASMLISRSMPEIGFV